MIYHVELQVYVNQYGDLCEKDSFYSNVYTSYKTAYERGLQELNRRIKKLKAADPDYRDKVIDLFVKERLCYNFSIHELIILDEEEEDTAKIVHYFDNNVQISDDTDLYELCRNQSSQIDYEFDYLGNIIYRVEIRGMGYLRMPSDYEENAGVRFAVGDVVSVENNSYGEKYCLVTNVPGRLRNAENVFNWENVYELEFAFIEEGKILKMAETFFEKDIEKVEDKTISQQVKKLISAAAYKIFES